MTPRRPEISELRDRTPTKRSHVIKNDTCQPLTFRKIRRDLLLERLGNPDLNTPKHHEESSEEYSRLSQMTERSCSIRRPLIPEASPHRDGWRQSNMHELSFPRHFHRRTPRAADGGGRWRRSRLPSDSGPGKHTSTHTQAHDMQRAAQPF